jgi:RPA family protein
MDEQQFKRNTAYKFRIGDVLIAKPVFEEERFSFAELGSKRIVRVNLVGNIVEKYESEGDKQYAFLTLDDGSGQIKLKAFGEDSERLKNVSQGDTVIVIGVLRHWNNEIYILPEIIRITDPKYLFVRKLEIEKERKKSSSDPLGKEEIIAVKDRILGEIKNAEENGGIEMDKLIMDLRDISPEIINQEVHKFLEEGIVFEPRPGKVRYLG